MTERKSDGAPGRRPARKGASTRADGRPAKGQKDQTKQGHAVPRLSAEGMRLLSETLARESSRSALRKSIAALIVREGALSEQSSAAAKEVLGRLWRMGRDLGAPIEESRHWALRYIDQVLCGYEFLRADPVQGGIAKNRSVQDAVRLLKGWQKQVQRHVEANPLLRLTVAEAFGMPEDDED